MFEKLKAAWRQAKFEADLRAGRAVLGRQGPLDEGSGAGIVVDVPLDGTIHGFVIEAGTGRKLHPYTREPLTDGELAAGGILLGPAVVNDDIPEELMDLFAVEPGRIDASTDEGDDR